LPIWNGAANVNEQLFFNIHTPYRWDGESDVECHIIASIDTANNNKNFQLQLDWEYFTPDVDVVPVTSNTLTTEIATGVALQYQTYFVDFTIDYDIDAPAQLESSDEMALRVRRIAASTDEITGEVIIHHMGLVYQRGDLLGEEEGMTEVLYLLAFVGLAVGLMIACYAFKKPVLGFGAAGGWLILGFYAYGFLSDLGIVYWGVRGALFFVCMGLVFTSVFEAMGSRGKKERGDDWEADDKRSEEEKEVDEMIEESEAQQRPGKKLRDYYGKNKKNKKQNRASTRRIARQEARKAMERGD